MPFPDPIVAGINLIREAIQSPNFVTNIAGWIIRKDGSAEFQDAKYRGDLILHDTIFNVDYTANDQLESLRGTYMQKLDLSLAAAQTTTTAAVPLTNMGTNIDVFFPGYLGITQLNLDLQGPANATATLEFTLTIDVQVVLTGVTPSSNTAFSAMLNIDGVQQVGSLVWTSGVFAERNTITRTWSIDLTAGSHTFEPTIRQQSGVPAGYYRANPTNTTIKVRRPAGG